MLNFMGRVCTGVRTVYVCFIYRGGCLSVCGILLFVSLGNLHLKSHITQRTISIMHLQKDGLLKEK